MAVPNAPRVIYQINPLDEVICQLRFPPILRIDAEPPAAFQDRIRTDYPYYESKSALRLPTGLPPEVTQLLAGDLPFAGQKSHTFDSPERTWNVTLTREFLALTCRRYERWEGFSQRLRGAFEALVEIYRPGFFTRLGLRYRDVIRRSKLNLADVPWAELIRPEVCGVLGAAETAADVEVSQATCLVRLPDDIGRVQLTSYLALDDETKETVFVIDADFFHDQQTDPHHAFQRLDALKRQAGLLFRWCITERLHRGMCPTPLPPAV